MAPWGAWKEIEMSSRKKKGVLLPTSERFEKAMRHERMEPLKSTVLIPHNGTSRELLAFVSCIGSPMNGGGSEGLVCTSGDTNMRTSACLIDERMDVREIQFEIPRIAEARFQFRLPCGTRNPFVVGPDEVAEIVSKTVLSLCVGGDKPFVRQKMSSFLPGPKSPGDSVLRASYEIQPAIGIGRIEKFWVELSWPDGTPQFKPICPNAGVYPGVYPRIPVAIYLVP